MGNKKLIECLRELEAKAAQRQNWATAHLLAWRGPGENEGPLRDMIQGWVMYAHRHQARYGSLVGDDGVLGPEWASIGNALRGLLNGETGRFNCGTLDRLLLDVATDNGVNLEE